MTVHIRHPHADGDKCVCGVRLSANPERTVALSPATLFQNDGRERCYLRTLRSWQQIDPEIDPIPTNWPHWPWDDPRYVRPVLST